MYKRRDIITSRCFGDLNIISKILTQDFYSFAKARLVCHLAGTWNCHLGRRRWCSNCPQRIFPLSFQMKRQNLCASNHRHEASLLSWHKKFSNIRIQSFARLSQRLLFEQKKAGRYAFFLLISGNTIVFFSQRWMVRIGSDEKVHIESDSNVKFRPYFLSKKQRWVNIFTFGGWKLVARTTF